MNIASPEDLNLINQLLDKQLIKKAPLIALLEAQKQKFDQLEQQLQGRLVLVDPPQKQLTITEQTTGHILLQRQLSWGVKRAEWQSWGDQSALINVENGNREAVYPHTPTDAYGLVLSEQGAYVYEPQGLKSDWLGYTQTRLFCGVAKSPSPAGPLDLYVSPDGSLLVLGDRGEGSLELLETRQFQTLRKLKLRPAGGTSAFSLAFDLKRAQVLITDQNSSMLSIFNLNTGELSQQKLGLGVLGSLVMAPDGEHVYLLTLKPNQELLYIRCAGWSVEKQLPLKGELFRGQGSDPCDLMLLDSRPSQARPHLLVMTYQHSPAPFTPIISLVDTQEVKTLRRTALKQGGKPCQLLLAQVNPLGAYRKARVKDMILAEGWVDAATLESLEQPQTNSLPAGVAPTAVAMELEDFYPPMPYVPAKLSVASGAAPPVLHSASVTPQAESVQQADSEEPWALLNQALAQNTDLSSSEAGLSDNQHQAGSHEKTSPALKKLKPLRPLKPLVLDPRATDVLLEMLTKAFQVRTGLDLSQREHLLRAEAERLREQLSRYERAEVNLEKVYEGHGLKFEIRRRELLVQIEQAAWLAQASQVIVPLDCPACHQKLMGQWECPVCGFELDSPLRLFKRQVASASATSGLALGHVLLSDPHGPRLLELNARKEIVWMLDAEQLSCDFPVDLVKLPEGNLLVTDSSRNQIYIIGPKGKIHWSLKTFASDQHRLRHPVKTRWYRPDSLGPMHYLIVDQGNGRVLEVDAEQFIHREFGAEHGLSQPSDVQYTPERSFLICDPEQGAVLEFNPDGQLEQRFADDYGLVRPMLAERLWNGHTLIVDAGSFQVIELDARGLVRDRIAYFKSGMPTELRLVDPSGLIRLSNQDLLLYNDRRAIQLMPAHKKLIWSVNLADLGATASSLNQSLSVPVISPPVLSQSAPNAPQAVIKVEGDGVAVNRPARVSGPLRNTRPAVRPLSPEARLQALIQKRTTPSDKESFEHSELYHRAGAELMPLSLYLIDGRHNGLIRINRKGKVTWHYSFEMGQTLVKPNFIQDNPHSLLITDTDQNRILEINKADKEIRQVLTGQADLPLASPRSALRLDNHHTLIADQRNKRLVELDGAGRQIWMFWNEALLTSPQYAEALPNGDVLFTDALLNRVLQIDREGQPKWYYGAPLKGCRGYTAELFGPTFATRLNNGNTLICDTRHHRVLEVIPEGDTVWEYIGHARNGRINPTRALRLDNHHTLITYFNHTKVIELDKQNHCVWSYSMGKDVFLPPVEGDDDTLVRHEAEKPKPFYNAIEKRMMIEARGKNKLVAELHIELMDNVQMKSVRAQLIMRVVEEHGMVYKSFPPPEDLFADRYGKHLILTCLLDVSLTARELAQKVSNIAEVLKVDVRLPKMD